MLFGGDASVVLFHSYVPAFHLLSSKKLFRFLKCPWTNTETIKTTVLVVGNRWDRGRKDMDENHSDEAQPPNDRGCGQKILLRAAQVLAGLLK